MRVATSCRHVDCAWSIKGILPYLTSGHQKCVIMLHLFTFSSARSTEGDVITVIGGDDNYKDDKEENREVISSWAKRKVSSQFGREYLDGRKSFIFSWNKQHRAVHEQALLHHFDPNKKGQRFEYQPPQSDSEPQLQETSTELENPYTSKSCSHNGKDASLLSAGNEENPTDSHPSDVSSAAGSSGDSAGMESSCSNKGDSAYTSNTHIIRPRSSEEPDINADSSSNVTEDHLQNKYSELKSCHGESSQNTLQPVLATQLPGNPPPVVVLRSIARYGEISYQLGDLQVWDPKLKIPDGIQKRLFTKHRHTPEVGVRLIRNSDGTLECHVYQDFKKFFLDEDIELAEGELLLMKTRIHHGKVSFNDVDVQFKSGNVHIPPDIIYGCTEKDSADLYIISGTERKFRVIVKRESASKRVRTFMKREAHFLSRSLSRSSVPNF